MCSGKLQRLWNQMVTIGKAFKMTKSTPKLKGRIDRIQDAVNSLIKVHADMRDSILASDQRDPRMDAVYFLMGRLLTHSNVLLKLIQEGFWTEATIIIRSMYETQWLLEYFDMAEHESEIHLRKWLKGEIIKPSKVRKKVSFDDNTLLYFHGTVYQELSQFIHPTYYSSTLNMNSKTLEYTYSGVPGQDKVGQFVTNYAAQVIMESMLEFLSEVYYDRFTLDRKTLMNLKISFEQLIKEFTTDLPRHVRERFLGFTDILEQIKAKNEKFPR